MLNNATTATYKTNHGDNFQMIQHGHVTIAYFQAVYSRVEAMRYTNAVLLAQRKGVGGAGNLLPRPNTYCHFS